MMGEMGNASLDGGATLDRVDRVKRRGYRSPIVPIVPIVPIFPILPILPILPIFPINSTSISVKEISCQKGLDVVHLKSNHPGIVL